MGARTAQGTATYWARLELQICDEVRFCVTLNIISPEKRLLVLEALGQTEAKRKCGRAPPTVMERELRTFLESAIVAG